MTPSDAAIRAALVRWTRAKLRRMEFTLADRGSETWERLRPQAAALVAELVNAEAALLALGNAAMLAQVSADCPVCGHAISVVEGKIVTHFGKDHATVCPASEQPA